MTPEQFCYWLQGMFEVLEPEKLNKKQVAMIKSHLDLVFNKVTPTMDEILDELEKEGDKPFNPFPYRPWDNPGTTPQRFCKSELIC